MPVLVVFSTFPDPDLAAEVARTVVGERLCACANLVPAVRSIYAWEGKLCDETETLAIMKTTSDRLDALIARLRGLHPYDVPEIVAVPVAGGHTAYLAWVSSIDA